MMVYDGESDFWKRAVKCKHENLFGYAVGIACWGAVGCSATEYHCRDCGVYFMECACRSSEGMSGWPWQRSKKRWTLTTWPTRRKAHCCPR